MVLPVYKNVFTIGTNGASSEATDMKTISDMESFSVSFDNGVEEWTPMDTEGWTRRLMTAKSVSISLSGKRNVGDAGNDYLASLYFANGVNASTKFEWTMIDGTKVAFNCVVNVSSAGGDSTGVDAIEAEISSDGKPTVTPPVVKG